MRIKYIFETHRNEDFIIGSIELAASSGAKIYHGFRPDWQYGQNLSDGAEFELGKIKLTAIATPGHTEDSMCYAVTDLKYGEPSVMVFTGDTLFIGSTGRVDLLGENETPRVAAHLYDSIFNRLFPLGDGVIICPAHSAGSLCGTRIADRDESTIGIEKKQNPYLKASGVEEFVNLKLAEHTELPPYFKQMEIYNIEGPPGLTHLPVPPPLSPSAFQKATKDGALIIDVRHPSAFGGAHVRGAYSIWLEGLSEFAGWFLPYNKPLLLVLEKSDQLEQTVRSLIRVGYDNIVGHIEGGIEGWYDAGMPVENLTLLTVFDLKDRLDRNTPTTLLDVRTASEFQRGHIKNAMNIFVGHLEKRLNEIPVDKPVVVYCSVGRRASIGASILLRTGFREVSNVLGSFEAWKAAGFPVEAGEKARV